MDVKPLALHRPSVGRSVSAATAASVTLGLFYMHLCVCVFPAVCHPQALSVLKYNESPRAVIYDV